MNTAPEERAELRTLHREGLLTLKGFCTSCYPVLWKWPCPTVRLLDDIEEMQRRLDAAHTTRGVANGASSGTDQIWYEAAETA